MNEHLDLQAEVETFETILMRLGWLEQKRLAHELSAYGLTVPQFLVLLYLWHASTSSPMGELAERMYQSSATMTGIVERLVRMGLVTRLEDPHDRRVVRVSLTDKGKALLQRVRQARQARVRAILSRLSDADRREFLRLVRLYLAAAEAEHTSPPE